MSDPDHESRPPGPAAGSGGGDPGATGYAGWERSLLSRLAFASLREQRRARRWGIFFKFALLAYAIVLLGLYLPTEDLLSGGGGKHTALIDLSGVIASNTDASADNIITALRRAFEDDDTAGVILRINSPGGSPVQAGYINDEMRRLRGKYPKIPLYAVVTDVCASGGYYVAAAADKIYADKSSVIGSIGVLMNGFGFVDAMKKVGIERRLLTAGKHKGLLDPFSPLNPVEVEHLQGMLDSMREQFIEVVKRGRGARLAADPNLFSGLVWTGEQAVGLGLVDALASSSEVAREIVGAEKIVDFTVRRRFLERIAERFGAALGGVVARNIGLDSLLPR